MHGCEDLLAFLQFPLALQSVFAYHFVAWRLFLAWRPCLATKGKRKTFLQPILEAWSIFALKKNFRTLDFKVRNSRSALRSMSSNGHNFFVSNPNHVPFEALD